MFLWNLTSFTVFFFCDDMLKMLDPKGPTKGPTSFSWHENETEIANNRVWVALHCMFSIKSGAFQYCVQILIQRKYYWKSFNYNLFKIFIVVLRYWLVLLSFININDLMFVYITFW